MMPVSSRHSRTAHSAAVSLMSWAPRERPLTCVAAALEEDGASLADNEEVAGRDEGVRLGAGRVVVVLSPAHVRPSSLGRCLRAPAGPDGFAP